MTSDSSKARVIGLLVATALAALAMATLLPPKWIPRTGHWEVEHFIAYFATTMILSIVSRRPIIVAGSLIMFAGILEALQGLTPDRVPDITSALCGAGGVISAATLVTFFIRATQIPLSRLLSMERGIASNIAKLPTLIQRS